MPVKQFRSRVADIVTDSQKNQPVPGLGDAVAFSWNN